MKTLKTRITTLAACCAVPMMLAATQANAYDFEVDGTQLTVGGYLKLTAYYDTDGTLTAPYNGDLYSTYDTPADGTSKAEASDLDMTARESRIFLKSKTESEVGTITTHLEGDFFADIDSDGPTWSNGNGFRIRHATIKVQNGKHSILAGQTWSNFMDFAGSLPSMDFSSDPGNAFVRQPQVKYQYDIRPGHYVAVSVENPTLGLCKAGTAIKVNCGSLTEDKLPDLVVKYFYANKDFTFSPRAVVRRFEIDGQSKTGYGLAAHGSYKFGEGNKFVLGVMYGDGIGRYVGMGFNAGAGLNDEGNIETLKYKSVTGGFSFAVTKKIDWTIGFGLAKQDTKGYEDGVLEGIAIKDAFSWHSNLYYNITKQLQYAIGVTSGRIENQAGTDGDMNRFSTYVRYSF